MRFRLVFSALVVLAGIVLAAPASASPARVTADLNMRTGPGVGYARIATIPAGSTVDVLHCLSDRNWCDVEWRGLRGWISRSYLAFAGYRPRYYDPGYYSGPPIIYFEYRERRYRRDHDRWHKKRPYPRRKAKRRTWNRDHDRFHRKHDPRLKRKKLNRKKKKRVKRTVRQEKRKKRKKKRWPPKKPD